MIVEHLLKQNGLRWIAWDEQISLDQAIKAAKSGIRETYSQHGKEITEKEFRRQFLKRVFDVHGVFVIANLEDFKTGVQLKTDTNKILKSILRPNHFFFKYGDGLLDYKLEELFSNLAELGQHEQIVQERFEKDKRYKLEHSFNPEKATKERWKLIKDETRENMNSLVQELERWLEEFLFPLLK